MGINLSEIKSIAVTIDLIGTIIDIDFSRQVDVDVLADLMQLKKNPGFNVYNPLRLHYTVVVPSGYPSNEVAEAIAKCFVQEHGLTVRRSVSDPRGKNTPFFVDSFLNS